MGSFFAGSSNITIIGGDFNDVKGNLTIFDHRRHTTNTGSNNTYTNNMHNCHNDNSTTISGWAPRDGDQMPSMASRSAGHREDYTPPPPPQRSRPIPQQSISAGSTVTNHNCYNVTSTNIDHAFNNNSENYYQGRTPSNTKGNHNGPQPMPGPDQEMNHEGPRSTSGPHASGQFKAPAQVPFQAVFPKPGIGGPYISVENTAIESMNQHTQRNFEKLMKFTMSQTQSMIAGNSGANYNPEAAYSSSPSVEGSDAMNTGMANLSLNDPSSSIVSTRPQISTPYLSSPTTFSRTKSDPQIGVKPTSPDQTGSTNMSTGSLSPYSNAVQQASHSNPSLAPHMTEPGMVNFLSVPPEFQQYGNSNRPPPAPTSPFNFSPSSSGGPNFNTYYGNVTKNDHRVTETNIDSFNQYNNTVKDSFNNNSYNFAGDASAEESNKKREFSEPDISMDSAETRKKQNNGGRKSPDSIRVEQPSSDEDDEEMSTAAENGVAPSIKHKGMRWPFLGKKRA